MTRKVRIQRPVVKLTAKTWDLAADYKAHGIDRSRAWSQFVIDRGLNPGIDAKDFYRIFDAAAPSFLTGPVETVDFTPTHRIDFGPGFPTQTVMVWDGDDGRIQWVSESGATGSQPKAQGLPTYFQPLTPEAE